MLNRSQNVQANKSGLKWCAINAINKYQIIIIIVPLFSTTYTIYELLTKEKLK